MQAPDATQSYVTFVLGEDEYALAVARLREIAPVAEITRIPSVPSWIRGVVNLRGTVLPVVDVSARFGFGVSKPSKRACLLVVVIPLGDEGVALGLLVDAVRRVIDVKPGEAAPPPGLGLAIAPRYLTGLVEAGQRFVALLDVDRVFSVEELATLLPEARREPAPSPPPETPSPPPETTHDQLLAAAQGTELVLFDDE